MSGWGSDLWDRGEVVITRTLAEADELGTALPRYLKERGEVEREYAKALRKLVAKYQVKEGKRDGSTETTQSLGFKSVLRELGFQAGQHEVLADSLSTTLPAKVKARAKELMKEAERCRKEAKVLAAGQEAEGRAVERAGGKYFRAQGEWETSVANVRRAEEEGQVSRNEEEKLRGLARGKQVQAEEYKARYAQQVVRANQRREAFYTSTLPAVLDSLHAINIERATSWQQTLLEALAAERAVVPILAKCREDMETALVAVSPEADCQLWVERYKTGNVPPGEYQFEDLSSCPNTPSSSSSSANAKTRTLSRVKSPETGENSNLFPRKRELEKRIASVEAEVAKGQKEMAALQLMVATYRQNPKFGDAAKFQGELEAAILRVQTLESDLHALTGELGEVDRRLALLRLSLPPAYSSNFSTPELRREGSVGSGSAAGSSVCGGSLQSVEQEGIKTNSSSNGSSTGSISSEKDNDSLEEPLEFKTRLSSSSQFSINHSHDLQSDSRTSVDNGSEQRHSDLKHGEDEWDSVDLPPPPLSWETPGEEEEVVQALYDFEGETASTLPMRAGELFLLLEPDSEGWSKVKRKEADLEEGYVPTSFIKVL